MSSSGWREAGPHEMMTQIGMRKRAATWSAIGYNLDGYLSLTIRRGLATFPSSLMK